MTRFIQTQFIVAIAIATCLGDGVANTDVIPPADDKTISVLCEELGANGKFDLVSLSPKVMQIVKEATGFIEIGELLDFRIADLDGDGTIELLARIDYSGRKVAMDVTLLSHEADGWKLHTIPHHGDGISLLERGDQKMVVGSVPLFELSRADPVFVFPLIYSWNGRQFRDVSDSEESFYRENVLPVITNGIHRLQAGENIRHSMSEAVGLALAVERINGMFASQMVSDEEIVQLEGKIRSLWSQIRADSSDSFLQKKFAETLFSIRRKTEDKDAEGTGPREHGEPRNETEGTGSHGAGGPRKSFEEEK